MLRKDGELLYSTCSILPTENEDILATFAERHDSVVAMPIEANWGEQTDMGRQLLPTVHANDGFFYAKLKKES